MTNPPKGKVKTYWLMDKKSIKAFVTHLEARLELEPAIVILVARAPGPGLPGGARATPESTEQFLFPFYKPAKPNVKTTNHMDSNHTSPSTSVRHDACESNGAKAGGKGTVEQGAKPCRKRGAGAIASASDGDAPATK